MLLVLCSSGETNSHAFLFSTFQKGNHSIPLMEMGRDGMRVDLLYEVPLATQDTI